MKIAILGDVGQPVYHVGDEAMTHAAVAELRRRGFDDLLVLSRNPAESRRAFGTDSAPTLSFPWPPEERSDYLARVLRAADGDASALPEQDQAWPFIDVLRGCGALVIAGGGNMNSIYGWLLYERAAAAAVARSLGLKVVVTGQTLGPDLHGPDRDVARDLLRSASLAGAREEPTLHLMREVAGDDAGVRGCLDDASFFASDSLHAAAQEPAVPDGPFIAATFGPAHGEADRNAYLDALAGALDQAAEATGCSVVFIPHMATPRTPLFGDEEAPAEAGAAVDESMHQEIAARMRTPDPVLLPIQNAARTAAMTARAAMVLTSRYHPVVFALDAAVPVVALAPEGYSDVRIRGALENWGAGKLALTLPSLFDGSFAEAARDVWKNRDAVSTYLGRTGDGRRTAFTHWWDAVAAVLNGKDAAAPAAPQEHPAEFPAGLDGAWQDRDAAHRHTFLPLASALARLRIEHEHLHGNHARTLRERDDARGELQAWKNSRTHALLGKMAPVRRILRGKK
ncbi:polysaccharide pyruvyl transferase family protein [Arthrobacter sp. NPDC055585]